MSLSSRKSFLREKINEFASKLDNKTENEKIISFLSDSKNLKEILTVSIDARRNPPETAKLFGQNIFPEEYKFEEKAKKVCSYIQDLYVEENNEAIKKSFEGFADATVLKQLKETKSKWESEIVRLKTEINMKTEYGQKTFLNAKSAIKRELSDTLLSIMTVYVSYSMYKKQQASLKVTDPVIATVSEKLSSVSLSDTPKTFHEVSSSTLFADRKAFPASSNDYKANVKIAIEKNYITQAEINSVSYATMTGFFKQPNCLAALELKLEKFTLAKTDKLSSLTVNGLLTDQGILALKNGILDNSDPNYLEKLDRMPMPEFNQLIEEFNKKIQLSRKP